MGIFRRGERLGGRLEEGGAPRRYKIKITTLDGQIFLWHKRGALHTVEEDVANVFVANFKPELFQVRPDGSLTPPEPGATFPIRSVEKIPI